MVGISGHDENEVIQLNQKAIDLLATWGEVGKIKKAPGTFGTLAALPLVWVLAQAGPLVYMAFTLIFTVAAIFIAEFYERAHGDHDSKEVVIDEVVGILVAMAWLPLTWQSFVAAFVLFRLLDIVKPPPIRHFDRNVKGGFGVVADDLIAGLITNVVLQVVFTETMWLGVQWIK